MIQLRLIFNDRAALSASIQNFGRLIDTSFVQQQQPRFSAAPYPHNANQYQMVPRHQSNNQIQYQNDPCKFIDTKTIHRLLMN